MKKLFFKLMVVGLATAMFASCKKLPNCEWPTKPVKTDSLPHFDPRLDIDLAAKSINFSVLKPGDKFNAVIQVEGIVQNIGRLNYASAPGEQSILLFEDEGDGNGYRLVATQPFQNLNSNATSSVLFSRNWNKSAYGKSAPTYLLVISYNPDIQLDGNPTNDDAVYPNDRLQRSGSEINDLPF